MKELTTVNVAIELKSLTVDETKSLVFYLGVPLNELDDIERKALYVGQVTIRFVQKWLDSDVGASWGKLVSGLKQIGKHVLANTIAQETQVQTTSNRLDVNISVLVRYLEQIRSERMPWLWL